MISFIDKNIVKKKFREYAHHKITNTAMESIGGRTESQTETFCRSTRRVRSSNKSAVKLDESKDQENVNNTIIDEINLDTPIKDEVTKSNTKVHATVNLNSSTPRRKKDPLANLHSNLSPKYIGFTTPPNQVSSSKEERTRSLRRRNKNSNSIADSSEYNELDVTFTPSNDSTVGFVRRTPRNKNSETTPASSAKRKKFLSPIDKLLIKNGAVMELNNNLALVDNEDLILENIEVHIISKRKLNIDEMGLDAKELEIYDEITEVKEHASISTENCTTINKPEDDEDSASVCREVAKQINEDEFEDEVEEANGERDNSLQSLEDENMENSVTAEISNKVDNVIKPNMDESKIRVPDKTKAKTTQNDIEEPKILVDTRSDHNNVIDIKGAAQLLSSINKTDKDNIKTTAENKCALVKVEMECVENAINNIFAADTSLPATSPSAISTDSAKGSSIINEASWVTFSTGDLFWGQIYTYCYWPCMICPDPYGKTITTEEIGRTGNQTVLVHVRFFADNGRRNWVKRENLMPYIGLENYQDRIVEVREKYGAKSAKYKLFVPTKRKEQVWYEAVKEANMVGEVEYTNRLDKFFEIFEKSKAFHKLEKQRRKSIYISLNSMASSDIESLYGSNDNINSLSLSAAIKHKRERSISPYSPAYSPIKAIGSKRRKISGDEDDSTPSLSVVATKTIDYVSNGELNLSQSHSVASSSSSSNLLNDLEIFNGVEFKKFYAVMKDFVMEQNHNEKLEKSLVVAVRNIWALKQLGRRQMDRKVRESMSPSLSNDRSIAEGSVKRLSSRLKTLMVRKSLMAQQAQQFSRERSATPKLQPKETVIVENVKKLINRPILEVIDDIFNLDTKYLFKGLSRDPVCKYCFKPGENLRRCAKNCTYWLHKECLHRDFSKQKRRGHRSFNGTKAKNESLSVSGSSSLISLTEVDNTSEKMICESNEPNPDVICKECANNVPVKCMVCCCTEAKKESDFLVKCSMPQCERSFHQACCKYWPQAKITISKNVIESFRCPSHVCHTCVSDDPKGKFQHLSKAKLTKCVKCPATFHTDSTCIPAGSQILTSAHIICPRHSSTNHDMTVNVNWCFICVGGGQLMCCETCPTAVHAHCLNIPVAANEGYICEECESGRMPLYGEMVWAKFTNFRWWPAIILPPTEIPKNIARKMHNPSDFVVRFFGTHDHGWISRRRVYLYLEGDSSEPPKTHKSSLDLRYKKGVEEAKEVYEVIKAKNLQQRNSNENKEKLHPQPYVRIKANRAVPPVKLHVDIESVSKCECDPREENPCGPDTNCLNRVLYHECNPKLCPAGERCQNQMFESRISPRLDVVYMKERGFGLICREQIKLGDFIIEYVGEIINHAEFQSRVQQKSRDRDENFYFLSVEKAYIIDAGPKGNLARFMNHSCDPNCETQKWSVNSLNRVGLFAIKDIPENTELTFNYHWDDLLGNEKKTCYCGAKNCSGQIGTKIKNLETVKEHTAVNLIGRDRSQTKTKINKKLINGQLNNKLVSKLKLKAKPKTVSKKKTLVSAGSPGRDANANAISKAVTEESEVTDEVSASRLLESPDIFS